MAIATNIKPRVKQLFKNPLLFGLTFGIIVIICNIAVPVLAQGSFDNGLSMFLSNGIFILIVPVAVGIQMGLFLYHMNTSKAMPIYRLEKVGVSGAAISSLGMAACCVCCITPLYSLLPAIGLSMAPLFFLARYKDAIIIFGLLINVIGIVVMLRVIISCKK